MQLISFSFCSFFQTFLFTEHFKTWIHIFIYFQFFLLRQVIGLERKNIKKNPRPFNSMSHIHLTLKKCKSPPDLTTLSSINPLPLFPVQNLRELMTWCLCGCFSSKRKTPVQCAPHNKSSDKLLLKLSFINW